jgi:hypothetical protein
LIGKEEKWTFEDLPVGRSRVFKRLFEETIVIKIQIKGGL